MRFPLVIPPLLLLILNLSSLDSDAVAFHNGSFVAVNSLGHVQFANSSPIDGSFATQHTRFRKSSTYDVKPLALADSYDSSEDTVPTQSTLVPQGSRGKRLKRDSQEDELAQAEQNVTDLTSEISTISEKLKLMEEEAKAANEKYEETKAAVAAKEKLAADWEDAEKARLEWVSANRVVKIANTSLDEATENLKRANETVDAAVKELKTVEDEPERLKNLTDEFKPLDAEHTTLKNAVTHWDEELPLLQQAAADAEREVSNYEAEMSREGCSGKNSGSRCKRMQQVLAKKIADRTTAQTAFETADADNKEKAKKLAESEPKWKEMKDEIDTLEMVVPDNKYRVEQAERKLNRTVKHQVGCLEKFGVALKSRDEVAEKEQLAKASYEDKASKVPADADDLGKAFKSAKSAFDTANYIKEVVDKDVNTLKSQLEEKNAELAQANAKVEALKQSNKEEPKKGATMYIGIGAGGGILLIILIIGGILFAVKRRKSKKKVEPSPTIDPDALKYEKVPILDKLAQQSTTLSNSNQRVPSAKSDANVSATQSSSNQRATPAKSDTNVAATQLSSTPATRAQSITKGGIVVKETPKGNDRLQYRGPDITLRPMPRAAPPTTHEKIADKDIDYIKKIRHLVNEIAKPTASSQKKPDSSKLPQVLKWAEKKVIVTQFGDEDLEDLPEELLDNIQDEEKIEKECDDTQYDRTAPEPDKRSGAAILDDVKDKTSVEDALKMGTWVLIAVHRRLNFKYIALVQLAAAARDVFKKEKSLVESGLPATIFGDIHGQVADAVRQINIAAWDPANPNSRVLDLNKQHFVFCGDYVDRGNRQVETLVLLCSLKVAYPNNVHMLRGNHETRDINRKYGFLKELEDRYREEDEGQKLYDIFNEVFDHLPLACHIGGKVLCVHGGISPHLHSLEDINKIPKPLPNIAVSPLAVDLLWADPINGLLGIKANNGRGISIHFGEDALEEMMSKLGLTLIIRGHQVPANGYAWFGENGRLVTVFVASWASKKDNFSGTIHIDERGVKMMHVMIKGSANVRAAAEADHRCRHKENNEKNDDYAVFDPEKEPSVNWDDTMNADETRL